MTLNEMNQLIEVAAQSKSDADYASLFLKLRNQELFFNMNGVSADGTIEIPLARVADKLTAVIFYVDRSDGRLKKGYAGIRWEKGLEMVLKMPAADGLVIQGSADAWVAIAKQKVEELLAMN